MSVDFDLLKRADAVFVGEVMDMGPPPPSWSGVFLMTQRVSYQVLEVLKGTFQAATIDVHHIVLEGAPTAGPQPGLSRDLFRPGNRLVVLVELVRDVYDDTKSEYHDVDPVGGVLEYSPDVVREIKAALAGP